MYANEESGVGGSATLIKPSLTLTHRVSLIAIKLPEFGNKLTRLIGVTQMPARWQPQASRFVISQFSPRNKDSVAGHGGTFLVSVQGQPGLHSSRTTRESYIVRSCLKQETFKKTKQKKRKDKESL